WFLPRLKCRVSERRHARTALERRNVRVARCARGLSKCPRSVIQRVRKVTTTVRFQRSGALMLTRTVPSLLLIGAAGLGAASRAASPKDFTVHEWGTFTTVAGEDGRAVDWLPLGGPTDLPCFVEHFQERGTAKIIPIEPNGAPLDYEHARSLMV